MGENLKGKRKPARKLPVQVRNLNIWEVLKNTNSNISVSDWLVLDKGAY
jgi:hypothetical protein